ncbi:MULTISPECIES: hypothetical protein [unclassified Flavobacterium]|jgi:hypothetical protein|uniref:hypothetical protein n=1 Tax=unclassified Flavobacterium TaxID=196869 RepID=UPI0025C28A27|nr:MULTISPECIES: hypothetical protein [unclassified Flavobacterium]
MENKLEIKFKNQKQLFEILEDEINVDLNTEKHKIQYNIPLEEIQKTQYINKNKPGKTTLILFASLLINVNFILLAIFDFYKFNPDLVQYILFTTCLLFLGIIKKFLDGHNEKHIDSSKLLYFIYTKNNAVEVDKFIQLIYQKQIEFFRKKYFKIDPVLPYNVQYERYIWLYSNKYINENEYEIIKEDLDKFFNFNPTV